MTWIVAKFPTKTLAKYYYLTVGAQALVNLAKVTKKSSTYDVTHKKPAPPNQKIFSSANYKTCRIFWHFDQVRNPYRSGDIPAQSHVQSSCFLRTA